MRFAAAPVWQWLVAAGILGLVVWLLAPILMPFLLGGIFAYIGNPAVNWLTRHRLPGAWAASLVFLAMVLVLAGGLFLVVPLVQRQLVNLAGAVPAYVQWVANTALPWLELRLHLPHGTFGTQALAAQLQAHLAEMGGIAGTMLQLASRSGAALVNLGIAVVLVPIVTFYLLRDWTRLVHAVDELLPLSIRDTVRRLAAETNDVLGAFMRGQLLVMAVLAIVYAIVLRVIGIEVGPLIGIFAGLVSFVPYLGFITGTTAGMLAAAVQYHDAMHPLLVLVALTAGLLFENYWLVPKLIGDRIGLHPVAVIFAVFAFGQVFGFLGVLLSLPLASVAVVVLRFLRGWYYGSRLYRAGREPVTGTARAPHAAATSLVARGPARQVSNEA